MRRVRAKPANWRDSMAGSPAEFGIGMTIRSTSCRDASMNAACPLVATDTEACAPNRACKGESGWTASRSMTRASPVARTVLVWLVLDRALISDRSDWVRAKDLQRQMISSRGASLSRMS